MIEDKNKENILYDMVYACMCVCVSVLVLQQHTFLLFPAALCDSCAILGNKQHTSFSARLQQHDCTSDSKPF